jgi:hypothetical protein
MFNTFIVMMTAMAWRKRAWMWVIMTFLLRMVRGQNSDAQGRMVIIPV